MTAPQTGAPEWAAAQASPWATVNQAIRIFDGFCLRTSVADRDLTAPPVSCADGTRYLIAAVATGAWAGQDGKLAIALGTNAANGWYFATAAQEGVQIWVIDEATQIEYVSGNWQVSAAQVTTLAAMSDVDVAGINDGDVLIFDLSNGKFIPATQSRSRELGLAISDETSNLTVGTAKLTVRMPYPMTLTAVRANVNTAPVGSTIIVDINKSGVSILSTTLTIDDGEKTSVTAAVPAVISDGALTDDCELTIDIDQVGSGTAGKGLKLWLIGTKAN